MREKQAGADKETVKEDVKRIGKKCNRGRGLEDRNYNDNRK